MANCCTITTERSNKTETLVFPRPYRVCSGRLKEHTVSSLQLCVLSDSEIQRVHEQSCLLLAETGLDIGKAEIAERLLAVGASRGKSDNRICLPATLIEESLSKCPTEFHIWSVDRQRHLVGANSRQYSTCLVDPGMNTESGMNRPPTLHDCAQNAKIIDALGIVTMPYKMDQAYEGMPANLSVAASNEQYFANCTKHVICGPCNKEDTQVWMEMAEIMSPESVRTTPIISVLISPSSPLVLHADCLDILDVSLGHGAPIICLPCPMCGMTSPLSVAGTLVQLNAENLALITLIQTLQPGHPVVYHTVAMSADMATATPRLSSPEKLLLGLAAAQLGKFYKMPSGTAGSSTEVSRFDVQNGAESMGQIMPAVLGPANIITGIGSNSNACGTSAEQILMDCEMIRLAERLREGIGFEGLEEAVESITRVQPGGDFLTDEYTAAQCRSGEFFEPDLFDWSGPGQGKGFYAKAKARAQEILDTHTPPVPQDRLDELKHYVTGLCGHS